MGREDDCLGRAHAPYEVAHLGDLVRVEPGGGLVKDQDLGVVQQGGREAHTLAIALGKLAERAGQDRLDGALLHHASQADGASARVETAHVGHEVEVLLGQHVEVERSVLGQVADSLLDLERVAHDVETGHRRGAGSREQVADDDLDRRGLARPVGAEQADHLALGDREGDPLQGPGLAVSLFKVL